MFIWDSSPYTPKERIKVRWDIRSFTEVNKISFMYPAALCASQALNYFLYYLLLK